jgi:hypothetical protein
MDKLTVGQYSALVRGAGGYIAQAHPFRMAWYIQKPGPADPDLLDGFETYNAGNIEPEANSNAFEFARKHKIPMQAGTDSHHTDQNFTSGVALTEKAGSVFDIIDAIKTGTAELILP